MFEEQVVGSVRLVRADRPGQMETGVWLVRDVRGRGVGHAAMAAVLSEAVELGATSVSAETTSSNAGAVAVLERLGFDLWAGDDRGSVDALIVFQPESEPAPEPSA